MTGNKLTQAFFDGQTTLLACGEDLLASEPAVTAEGLLKYLKIYHKVVTTTFEELLATDIPGADITDQVQLIELVKNLTKNRR